MVRTGAFLAALASVGCATTSGAARPSPFPGAATPTPTPGASTARPAVPDADARSANSVIRTALELRGTPYRLGGDNPSTGFDCSGFVQYVFDRHQVELPRTVAEQYGVGKRIAVDQIRAGDLLFFATTAKGPTHVGIAIGSANDIEFVHAPDSGGAVRIERLDSTYWHPRLIGVRRVL
jgi:cell wall-associated NlpC family hydrolase